MGAYKKSRGKIILIAQEIELAKELASNSKPTRDKALRKLRKWFISRSQGVHKFENHDFLRIWKGLFYCMWMSDKPLIQEELAQEISTLIHSLATLSAALKFVQASFQALSIEWFGIDDLRINKFMMLVRRIVRQSFTLVQKGSWDQEDVKALADTYYTILVETNSLGLKLHLIEIYCEELAKIGGEDLSTDNVFHLISPFGKYLASTKDGRLISHITRNIFLHLIHQSDAGIEYEAKFNTWKQLGFPGGTIDAIERTDAEELDGEDRDEPEENELDPRAGRVNVELPCLLFKPEDFIAMFTTLKNGQETTVKARKTIVNLIQKFEKLSEGKFPLGMQNVDLPEAVPLKKDILRVSKKLRRKEMKDMENKLTEDEDNDSVSVTTNKPAKLNWSVTNAINKSEGLGKENIAGGRKMDNWQVKPSSNKRKRNTDNVLGDTETTEVKKTKLKSTLSFQISDAKKQGGIKSSEHVCNTGGEPGIVKVSERTAKNCISTVSDAAVEKTNGNSVVGNIKKKKNEKLNKSLPNMKNNGWGGEWDSKLQEGESDIYVPSKKYMRKLAKGGGNAAMAEFLRRQLGESEDMILNPFAASPRNKKVEFALSKNSSQEHKEYRRSLKRNSDVPFHALTQPKKGVLKSTPVGSPVNPFFGIFNQSSV